MATQFLGCDALNVQTDGSCSQPVWVDVPTVLPPLSISDASTLIPAILLCWALGFAVRAIRRLLGV